MRRHAGLARSVPRACLRRISRRRPQHGGDAVQSGGVAALALVLSCPCWKPPVCAPWRRSPAGRLAGGEQESGGVVGGGQLGHSSVVLSVPPEEPYLVICRIRCDPGSLPSAGGEVVAVVQIGEQAGLRGFPAEGPAGDEAGRRGALRDYVREEP